MRKPSENCYSLIRQYEGYSSKVYKDIAQIPTIGYGNTQYENGKKVTMNDPSIDVDRAKQLSAFFFDKFAKDVDSLVKSNISQNQFDALVSFAYNVGTANLQSSTLLKKVNINPNELTIRDEFMKWNKITKNGQKVASDGLTNRRKKEADIYFKTI